MVVSKVEEQANRNNVTNISASMFFILKFIGFLMCNYNQISKAFKGIYDYLERTEKNRITTVAAAPIATIGSKRLEKKGSGGSSPLVNG